MKSFASVVTVARLAQSVEHETLNLRVVGSSPTLGDHLFLNFKQKIPLKLLPYTILFKFCNT